jgi:hypothetical protein
MANNLGRGNECKAENSPVCENAPLVKCNSPIFLAALFDGRKVTIRRNASYEVRLYYLFNTKILMSDAFITIQETIQFIKDAFPSLRSIPADHIAILAHFADFGDLLQITRDLWPDLMPSLMTVQVNIIGAEPPSTASGHHAGSTNGMCT